MLTISKAADYCASKVTDFPINKQSISRKLYSEISAGRIKCKEYTSDFGPNIKVIDDDNLDKFIKSDEFKRNIDVQRKKYQKKHSPMSSQAPVNCKGVTVRGDNPIVGDIYTAPAGYGFSQNSILLVTSTGANNVLIEEITPDRSSEINSGEIKNPVSFARSINEINNYNYFGNASNMGVAANKLSVDRNYTF